MEVVGSLLPTCILVLVLFNLLIYTCAIYGSIRNCSFVLLSVISVNHYYTSIISFAP